MDKSKQFEQIYLKYSDKIYKYIYISTTDVYLAEDITAEVFLKLWKKWRSIRLDFIQALLYKTAKNTLIDYYRKQKNNKKVSLEDLTEKGLEPKYDEDLIEKIQTDENIQKINSILKFLPEKLRQVIALRFTDDLSAKETALILETSEVNVRVLQYRAIKKLKELLKNESKKSRNYSKAINRSWSFRN